MSGQSHTAFGRLARLAIAVGVPSRLAARDRARVHADTGWGWLPVLSLWGACGLVLVAIGNNTARAGAAGADLLFWAGLLLVYVPIAARMLAGRVARHERIGLLVLLGLGLYLVKLLHSPLAFTFSDELQHWRTASDIVQTGSLFHENPLLPVSPLYPGLENLAVGVSGLTGLSLFGAGAVMLGVARLVGMLALYLFFEQVGRSARLAGLAALLYAANPNYVFFDAQFAYESLALPLATLVLFAAARRSAGLLSARSLYGDTFTEAGAPSAASLGGERIALTLVIVLVLGAVVITHHVTAYALTAFLGLWAFLASLRADDRFVPMHPRGLALFALVLSLTWLVYAASLTTSYLFPPISGSVTQLLRLIVGEAVGRQLFRSPAGLTSPLWEQLIGYLAIVLILLGLPLGLLRLWHSRRDDPLALALGVGALGYPASLAMRLAKGGAETSNRGSAFLFVAVVFVLAAWVAERPLSHWLGRRWAPVFVLWLAIIFAGGVAVGWPPPWARMPGPYLPAADMRSIDTQSLRAADWMRATLGPSNRLVTDRTNRLLMGAYAGQRPVTSFSDKLRTWKIFFAPALGTEEHEILARGRVQYLVVDRRLSDSLPATGAYFERSEVEGERHDTPIEPAALAKFDGMPEVGRLFDSGDIAIYDVSRLR